MSPRFRSSDGTPFTERFEVAGANLVDVVKRIFAEGNTRRITIRDRSGKELLAIPMSWGVTGAAAGVILAPLLALVAAIGGAVAEVTLDVERYEDPADAGAPAPGESPATDQPAQADQPGEPGTITGA